MTTAAADFSTSEVLARVRRSATLSEARGNAQLAFHAMGTVCRVQCGGVSPLTARPFFDEVLAWVARFEARYSRFLPGSVISRINAAAGQQWVEVDSETEQLLELCGEMVFVTRGVFDPTTLPLIRLWNWKTPPPALPTAAQIQAAAELCGWNKLERRPGAVFLPCAGMCLDFGGIGKEYAVDRVTQLAGQWGLANVLVDFGQDVRVAGHPTERPAWHVGLEDPKQPGHAWTGLALTRHAVATSGDYLRHFMHGGRRYGHIVDPRDGQPVRNGCLSVSVIAPTCTQAGILSTSAFILGPTEGLQLISQCLGAEGCIITSRTRHQTRRFHEHVTR
jgi:thiamine biosynthesis lipoprotein